MEWNEYREIISKQNSAKGILTKPIKAFCLKPSLLPLRVVKADTTQRFVILPDAAESPFGKRMSITAIEQELFCNNTVVRDIVLPRFLEKIPADAFRDCENLERIFIPLSIKEIGKNAFKNCKKLSHIFYEGSAEQWEKLKPATCYTKTELSKENIPGTPVCITASERTVWIKGNEPLSFAEVHFNCTF